MIRASLCLCGAFLFAFAARATEPANVTLHAPAIGEARWTAGLMAERFECCRSAMVPSMWRLMAGKEPTQFLENFRVAAGLADGRHRGPKWNDGDFYKWLEGAAAVYAITRDEQLDRWMDESIAVIAKAQRADGYLHTPVLISQRNGGDAKPLANPLDFELYNMGHLMSAACVHHRATGKKTLLDVARRAADWIGDAFADPTPELAHHGICPAHYMGLVELSRVTGDRNYANLARKMLDMRDLVKDGTDDNQDRIPFRQQTTAAGHAVRANYLYAGAADIYAETGDPTLLPPLVKIWDDVVSHKLYLTGGCGALYDGASPDGAKDQKAIARVHQSYGRDYQLPSATAHNETCAAIGSLLWNRRMLLITGEPKYADVIEQTLYNSVLAGVSLDGTSYFYTNPLRVTDPMPVALRWSRQRQPFISVFCCPPNLVRTIAESAGYAYATSDRGVWVTLYGASTLKTQLPGGTPVEIQQATAYPWDGKVRITVSTPSQQEWSLMLRIPAWARGAAVRVNGAAMAEPTPGTFIEVRRKWAPSDTVDLDLPMPPRLVEANPLVEETRNQVAVMRGPIVYCLESCDLPEAVKVLDMRIPRAAHLESHEERGMPVVTTKAATWPAGDWAGKLYRDVPSAAAPAAREIDLKLIPYFTWANRGKSQMTVWIAAGE